MHVKNDIFLIKYVCFKLSITETKYRCCQINTKKTNFADILFCTGNI